VAPSAMGFGLVYNLSMAQERPGMRPERLARLARRAVHECALDLRDTVVLTEAATGAYVVTAVLAALGGAARVDAVTRATRHGSVTDVTAQTRALADLAGVADRIHIHTAKTPDLVGAADVITNSGHLRPIDATTVGWMRPSAVVPLMFESWEIDLGRDDVDLSALHARGIRVAGTNERHPHVDVFAYLGPMAVALLTDAAIAVRGSNLLVLCDNPFSGYLETGLRQSGADVVVRPCLAIEDLHDDVDAVVVALRPRQGPVLGAADVTEIAQRAPTSILVQFWGDLPLDACRSLGVPTVPAVPPPAGHMGILPSALGPEPVVRLQAGGLKVASILLQPPSTWTEEDGAYVDPV
jgi:hypothetical protein